MNMKRIVSLLLAALMLGSVLCGCQQEQPTETTSGNASYKVTVIGADGNPMTTGVVVKFMQDGVQKAMQTVDAGGTAIKSLPRGDYQVELMFPGEGVSFEYDKTDLKLTGTKTEMTIELFNRATQKGETLSIRTEQLDELGNQIHVPYESYVVYEGRTMVDLTGGDSSYFIFYPLKNGIYHFTVEGNKGTIGYYGSPYFVLPMNAGTAVEGQENVISVTVAVGSEESAHVLAIHAPEGVEEAVMKITRVGDLPPELPFLVYQMKATDLKPYVHNGAAVQDFDLSQKYDLVLNPNDGYYHLNSADGPLVLVKMGHNADKNCKYLSSIFTVTRNDTFYRYYYDEKGELVEKLGFMECLNKYLDYQMPEQSDGRGGNPVSYTYVDYDTGLYPLTEDLKFIIQETGAHRGWWDAESHGFLFQDEFGNTENVDPESAWLFLCCYAG